MDSLLPCLLLASVLALALSTEDQREMPTIAMLRTAGSLLIVSSSDSDCSLMFDDIGPFCQYVYRYQSGFSSDTISICMDIMHACRSLVWNAEDICSSRLTSSCAGPVQNDFFMDYCGMVQVACPEVSDESASGSGDNGSAESGSGSAKLTDVSVDSLGSGSGSGQPKSGGGLRQQDDETVLTTTLLPYTTIAVS